MVFRRTILKSIGLIGLAGAAAALPLERRIARAYDLPPTTYRRWNGEPLARITWDWQSVRAEPSADAERLGTVGFNELFRVRRVVEGQATFPNNNLWLETKVGYLYASLVQPIRYHLPQAPVADLGGGRWAELIVPSSESFFHPDSRLRDASAGLVFYNGVFNVRSLAAGADGHWWYECPEAFQTIYVRASHLRLIPRADLEPITPEIAPADKHIEIYLDEQLVVAFEYDAPVWAHPVSSGINEGDTPEGVYNVHDKRIGTRMTDASVATGVEGTYDLAGVGFVNYFTGKGVGLHGTYWHNDYGRPRSHGCVNLPNDAARWLWRWTTPHPPQEALFFRPERASDGTRIVVKKSVDRDF
jgi:hypothetical protein